MDIKALREAFDEYAENVEDLRNQVSTVERAQRDMCNQIAAMRLGVGSEASVAESGMTFEARNQIAQNFRAAMTTGSNPEGGYLVPEQLDAAILKLVKDDVALRRLARSVRIENAGSYIRHVCIDGTAAVWVGETESRPETAGPTWAQIAITPGEIYAQPKMSKQVIEDARIDLVAEIQECISEAFSQAEGGAFLTGNGIKKPRGFLDYPTVANGSYEWGKIGYVPTGVAAALTDTNNNGADALINLVYALRPRYRAGATWLMNSLTACIVRKLKDGEGRYLWTEGSVSTGQPSTLLGIPVAIDEGMPSIGAGTFPIALADWQQAYTIVDRTGINVVSDPFTEKPFVKLYTTKRVGGAVTNYEAIKLLKVAAS